MLGDYEFSLKVTDNSGAESTADVVTVSLCGTIIKNVTASFPAYTSGDTSINFAPTYTSAIVGGGFADGDVTYTLTDDLGHTWNGPNYVVNVDGYDSGTTPTFTQIFKLNGEEVARQVIMVDCVFSTWGTMSDADNVILDPQAIPPIDLTLSKKVTTGAITTTLDTTVSFVSLAETYPATTIDFSPTALPEGVTYIVTDNSTPQKKWELYKDGFNGKVAVSNYDATKNVTFTQTFYLYGVEITSANSKRTVVVAVSTGFNTRYSNMVSDSGTVTLKYP